MSVSSTATIREFISIFRTKALIISLLLILCFQLNGQVEKQAFFAPADSLNKPRFYTALAFTATSYTATSIGLYQTWYKQFDQSKFHGFDDWNEWQNMDKFGHAFTAYNLSNVGYQGARWTGMSKKNALLFAGIGSTLIQSTIEIMDGFSTKWGFSTGDVAFNTLGTAIFVAQEAFWDEQKIRIKISSSSIDYPTENLIGSLGGSSSLRSRVDQLYGKSGLERFLKDYNAQTIWASANIYSLLPRAGIPKWLNLALGYSGENMFGGFENVWVENGETFGLDPNTYPRYHQFILSFDADLNRIKTKNHFVNMLLAITNGYKLPSPAIEYNSLGEWRFHLLFRT